MTIKIFAQKFQLDGFFLWFLGLWTTHSCRETFVTNLFTEKSLLALTTHSSPAGKKESVLSKMSSAL